ESFFVQSYTSIKPSRIGTRSGHQEYVVDSFNFSRTRLIIAPPDAVESPFAFKAVNFGERVQSNLGAFFDSSNQIARHSFGKPPGANQNMHVLGGVRQENRGLSG